MRTAELSRKTKETDIAVSINVDGTGTADISTGIGFFDHMLTALSVHSGIDIKLAVKGDLNVDGHHTVEDTGIVLGKALAEALIAKEGITRYGNAFIPMDESLGFAAVDISGRPFIVFNCEFKNQMIGELDSCLVAEFFRALAYNAGITLHIGLVYGENDHHKAEALFKAVAYALKSAVKTDGSRLLSTKGVI